MAGRVTGGRALPGAIQMPGREFRYLEWDGPEPFREVFPLLLAGGTAPPPSAGGMLNEEAVVTTPDGRAFHGVSYRGDLAGFRAALAAWCAARGAAWARIDGDALACSDGARFPLAGCGVTLG